MTIVFFPNSATMMEGTWGQCVLVYGRKIKQEAGGTFMITTGIYSSVSIK